MAAALTLETQVAWDTRKGYTEAHGKDRKTAEILDIRHSVRVSLPLRQCSK
jgi:hypothetical protein